MRININRILNALKHPAAFHEEQDTVFTNAFTEERTSGLTFYYLKQWLNQLPAGKRYCLQEELPSGTVVTHMDFVNWNSLEQYVTAVFIPVNPPRFIITEVGDDY